MQRTERLLAIMLLLQARGKMPAHRLAELLGVSTRTIYRDMDILSLAHVPVSMEHGRSGGYYLLGEYRMESAIFTREEAISLMLSAGMVGNTSLFADDNALHRALLKLEAALPEEYRSDISVARERILFDTQAWASHPPTRAYLDTIRFALLKSLQVDILYPCGTDNLTRWQRVDPYGLVYKGLSLRQIRTGLWYLVAFCHSCQTVHTFRVRYIEDVKVREQPITTQLDFDLHSYWDEMQKKLDAQNSTVELLLHVSPSAKHRLWGDYVVLHEEADGSSIVRVQRETIDAAVSYSLSMGADVLVLEPVQVRDTVAATAQHIAELYGRQYKQNR